VARIGRLNVAVLAAAALLASLASPAAAATKCRNGKSKQGAMWLSIAHPGLGEWYLKDWGDFGNAPQKKFWLGFIPIFGWPGYLQVKSAVDAYHCERHDDLWR
jgi:hypothetical protein